MKNKKLTFVLIPLVLALWGTILYRIFHVVNGDKDSDRITENAIVESAGSALLPDTFSIHPDYRDPFGAKRINKVVFSENKVSAASRNTIIKNEPLRTAISITPWPTLTYSGLIKNQKSNVQLAMVQINGQASIMKTGDIISGVELLKIVRDSIEVKFRAERRFVRK